MRPRGTGCLFRPQYRTRAGVLRTAGVWHWKAPSGQRWTTGERQKTKAQRWVLDRLADMRAGVPVRDRTATYDALERLLLDTWEAQGRKGVLQAVARLKHLRRAFAGWEAAAITSDRVTAYAVQRRREGAAAATVNLELALLHRAFALGRRVGLVQTVPIMDRLKGIKHRTGTIERGDLEAVLAQMPPRYVPLLRFLYLTGWREGEGRLLTWDCVDEDSLYLPPERSKTGQARRLAYRGSSELVALLEAQRQKRSFGPYVFPGRAGKPLDRTALQKAWRRSCRLVGVPMALIHDLRRTAARDLRRAGVAPYVAMAQLGHRDARTHQGYSVVLPEDQADGLARLEALRAGEPAKRTVARMP
jgi:integrase